MAEVVPNIDDDVILFPFSTDKLNDEDKDKIVQEYKKLDKSKLPEKMRSKGVPASWRYPGNNDKMISGIPTTWTLLPEEDKRNILTTVLREKAKRGTGLITPTGNNEEIAQSGREPATTKDDYARVLHIAKKYASIIHGIHQVQARDELDARKSKARSTNNPSLTLGEEVNGWEKLADLFNDPEEIFSNIAVMKVVRNGVEKIVATDSKYVSIMDRVQDINPSNPNRHERSADWVKQTWRNIKTTMTTAFCNFEKSGKQNADNDTDVEFIENLELIENTVQEDEKVEDDLNAYVDNAYVKSNGYAKGMSRFASYDWVLYGFCFYDEFDLNFGKTIDNNLGRDSERVSTPGLTDDDDNDTMNTSTSKGTKRLSGNSNDAIASAISKGYQIENQQKALEFFYIHGDDEEKVKAKKKLKQIAGI